MLESETIAAVPGYHTAVAAIMIDRGRVLMARRTASRIWAPGRWGLPGGHVERDEDEPGALLREAREELGVTLELAASALAGRLVGPNFDVAYYTALRWRGALRNAAPGEHSELAWMSESELSATELADPAALPIILHALRCSKTPGANAVERSRPQAPHGASP